MKTRLDLQVLHLPIADEAMGLLERLVSEMDLGR